MPIRATCDSCFSEFTLKDEMAGRKFRCKDCGAVVQAPAGRRQPTGSRSGGTGRPAANRRPASQRRRPVRDEFADDRDDYSEPRRRPARGGRGKSRKKSGLSGGTIALLGVGGFLLLVGLAGLFVPGIAMLYIILALITGVALSLWGGIKLLVTAFQEDAICGVMFLFVPFYWLYFTITRWHETSKPFIVYALGVVAVLSAIGMMFSMKAGANRADAEFAQLMNPGISDLNASNNPGTNLPTNGAGSNFNGAGPGTNPAAANDPAARAPFGGMNPGSPPSGFQRGVPGGFSPRFGGARGADESPQRTVRLKIVNVTRKLPDRQTAAEQALLRIPGYVPDSVQIDEPGGTVTFEFKGFNGAEIRTFGALFVHAGLQVTPDRGN